MRVLSIAAVASLAILLTTPAVAQEAGSFEAFGGFTYIGVDTEDLYAENLDVSGLGFQGQFTYFVKDWLGIAAEVGYHTGDLNIPEFAESLIGSVDFAQTTFLFGPRFVLVKTGPVTATAHGLIGLANGSVNIHIPLPIPGLGLQDFGGGDVAFATALGGSVDLALSDDVAWRLVQPDLLFTSYQRADRYNFRIATGVVARF